MSDQAPSINETKRDRLKAFATAKRWLKPVDTAVENAQRHVQRIIDRKDKIPETREFELLANYAMVIEEKLRAYEKMLDDLAPIFFLGAAFPDY